MKPGDLVLALAVMSLAFPHASQAAPPPPPPLCSATGKPPVMVREPLRFCGYEKSGMTCCDTAQDAALGALIKSMNLPKPDAMVVKKSLCQKRCRPQEWSDEQQTLDSLVQQLLAPQNTWLLLAAPFILWIWYQVFRNFVASCLGAQTPAPSPRNERPNCSICTSMLCMCCSTMSYMGLNRNGDGESTRGNNTRSSGASIEMNEV